MLTDGGVTLTLTITLTPTLTLTLTLFLTLPRLALMPTDLRVTICAMQFQFLVPQRPSCLYGCASL